MLVLGYPCVSSVHEKGIDITSVHIIFSRDVDVARLGPIDLNISPLPVRSAKEFQTKTYRVKFWLNRPK